MIVQALGRMLRTLKEKGLTVVLVEQNFRFAAPLADRHYVLSMGAWWCRWSGRNWNQIWSGCTSCSECEDVKA